MGGQAKIALPIQRKAAAAGVLDALSRLDGEKAIPFDGEVERQPRLLQASLAIVHIELTGSQDIALLTDHGGAAFVLITYPADQHFLEGAVRILLRLIPGGGEIRHVVGNRVQPAALGQDAGGQVVKPFCHMAFSLLLCTTLLCTASCRPGAAEWPGYGFVKYAAR